MLAIGGAGCGLSVVSPPVQPGGGRAQSAGVRSHHLGVKSSEATGTVTACESFSVTTSVNNLQGFVRSWKTWKSHGILKWSFPSLEKSWKKRKS